MFSCQVYYERVNTHSASTSFAHACCGQRDASRNLVLDSKTPITKVRFSKGFAFANIEAASGKYKKTVKNNLMHNLNLKGIRMFNLDSTKLQTNGGH